MSERSVMVVFGTRPEAIKLAPVISALRRQASLRVGICVTGQHRGLLDQALAAFGIAPDHDLDLMRDGQTPAEVTSRALAGVAAVLAEERPDLVLVQGDTASCLAGALAGFYAGMPVAHVEAGLRTGALDAPFPEEGHRAMVARIASLHFAPTPEARANLTAEGIAAGRVHVTGNTAADTVRLALERLRAAPDRHWAALLGPAVAARLAAASGPLVLVTGHRRESFGAGLAALAEAVADLARAHPHWTFVHTLHPNPAAREPALAALGGIANALLVEAADYLPFVWLLGRADLVVSDSGGLQEEAACLGKPILVARRTTERPELVAIGAARLVDPERGGLAAEIEAAVGAPEDFRISRRSRELYGDGYAAERIAEAVAAELRRQDGTADRREAADVAG